MTRATVTQSDLTGDGVTHLTQDGFNRHVLSLLRDDHLSSRLSPPMLEKIAVAVSGGVDSMALCYLMQSFCADNNIQLYTFTVDHGLRAESSEEVLWVKKTLNDDDIHCDILTLDLKAGSSVQLRARQARFDALAAACEKYDIQILCTAHHGDDLQESFFYRLVSGSGLTGLSSIVRPSIVQPSIVSPSVVNGADVQRKMLFLKPLLMFNKNDLCFFLKSKNKENIEDLSNIKPIYTRNRLRSLLAGFSHALEKEGLSLKRLKTVLMRLNRANTALDFYSSAAEKELSEVSSWGGVVFNRAMLVSHPDEIIIRLLMRGLSRVAPHHDYSKLSAIEALSLQIRQQDEGRTTLLGCVIDWRADRVTIGREYDAIQGNNYMSLISDKTILWDHRFQFCYDGTATYALRAYQDKDAAILRALYGDHSLADIAPIFRYGLPVIVDADDRCISAPWLNTNNPLLGLSFSLLSHEKHLD